MLLKFQVCFEEEEEEEENKDTCGIKVANLLLFFF